MINKLVKIAASIPDKIKQRLIRNIVKHIDTCYSRIQALETIVRQTNKMSTGVDFQGQVNQDLCAYLYFNGKKEGFYIDIGANDGKSISNTVIFENLGWKGICVEPLPEVFAQLRQNRRCDCVNVAIANVSGDSLEFVKATGVEMLSGLNAQMTEVHKKKITNARGKLEKINVKTLTFADLMSDYPNVSFIDFMSIDVEGAELSILKTIDFQKFHFGLITVENNEETEGDGERLKKYMDEQGYRVHLDLGLDIMFCPKA
jgi:FkbM family methyltransferase